MSEPATKESLAEEDSQQDEEREGEDEAVKDNGGISASPEDPNKVKRATCDVSYKYTKNRITIR